MPIFDIHMRPLEINVSTSWLYDTYEKSQQFRRAIGSVVDDGMKPSFHDQSYRLSLSKNMDRSKVGKVGAKRVLD